jgi:hypothetical protein
MATVDVQIPTSLGLTEKQMSDLEESFKKQFVDTLKGKVTAQKASPQLMAVEVRAKLKKDEV